MLFNGHALSKSAVDERTAFRRTMRVAVKSVFGNLLVLLVVSNLLAVGQCRSDIIDGIVNSTYDDVVSRGNAHVYEFTWSLATDSSGNGTHPLRLTVSSNATDENHLTIVVRSELSVLSWAVPFAVEGGLGDYMNSSRTICPDLSNMTGSGANQTVFVDVSTASSVTISYSLVANLVEDFTLVTGQPLDVELTPSGPLYYQYKFEEDDDYMRVVIESNGSSPGCGIVSLQEALCPVYDLARDIQYSGAYQTFTTSAAVVVQRRSIRSDSLYVVLLGLSDDGRCDEKFQQQFIDKTDGGERVRGGEYYTKSVSIKVVKVTQEYWMPVLVTLAIFLGFYVLTALALTLRFCHRSNRNLTLGGFLFGTAVDSTGVSHANGKGGQDSPNSPSATRLLSGSERQYGAVEVETGGPTNNEPRVTSVAVDGEPSDGETSSERSGGQQLEEPSCLPGTGFSKLFSTTGRIVSVAEVCQSSPAVLDKQLSSYPWLIGLVGIFYGLPVMQLVYNYQTILNLTGNQDLCFYNFRCIRRLGGLSAFNNVFSNIGYILLGILFFLLTLRRQRLYLHKAALDPHFRQCMGLPQHFGLFYALGLALCVEGVMSACYHVCPTPLNIQFDTTFMYIIICLANMHMYQSRHPDIIISAPRPLAFTAVVITIVALGVLYNTPAFWACVFVLHMTATAVVVAHFYFNSLARMQEAVRTMLSTRRVRPVRQPYRCLLLTIAAVMNLAIAVYGVVSQPAGFSNYMLSIMIANLVLYTGYYCTLKLLHLEPFRQITLLYFFLCILAALPATYYYLKSPADWSKSPAYSRSLNSHCTFLDFFDSHDLWHICSALFVFFTYLALLTIDDPLANVARIEIPSW
eukprot:scpid38814/ scgid24829/ SID1 transmembrane family member 1